MGESGVDIAEWGKEWFPISARHVVRDAGCMYICTHVNRYYPNPDRLADLRYVDVAWKLHAPSAGAAWAN